MNLVIPVTRAVHKHKLFTGKNELWLPKGSKFLQLGNQHGQPESWWLVPTPVAHDGIAKPVKKVMYLIHGHETGKRFQHHECDQYLGTVLVNDEKYVLHFFWYNTTVVEESI